MLGFVSLKLVSVRNGSGGGGGENNNPVGGLIWVVPVDCVCRGGLVR